MEIRTLVDDLRREFGVEPGAAGLAPLYETYLKRDSVDVKEGAALVVGIDPAAAPTGVAGFEQVETALAAHAGSARAIPIPTLVRFADESGVVLPWAFTELYGFIQKTLLVGGAASGAGPFAARATGEGGEPMVTLLGAALNVVSNFPNDARNAHGLVDAECIARVIAEKSVVWFGADPVPFSHDRIVEILDEWLK